MFEFLDDPSGTPIDEGTRSRVAEVVRLRAVRRRVGVAVVALVAVALPTGLVLPRSGGEDRTVAATGDDTTSPIEKLLSTTSTTVEPPIVAPTTSVPIAPTTPTTTRGPTTTAVTSAPPTTSRPAPSPTPTLQGEWTIRSTFEPDPRHGPDVRGEVGVRRVEGTPYRWTASFVATGLEPKSRGSILISHESNSGGTGPFASTACEYQADATGRGTCTGEFDTYEYTNDPDRSLRWASLGGPTGHAVAHARLA